MQFVIKNLCVSGGFVHFLRFSRESVPAFWLSWNGQMWGRSSMFAGQQVGWPTCKMAGWLGCRPASQPASGQAKRPAGLAMAPMTPMNSFGNMTKPHHQGAINWNKGGFAPTILGVWESPPPGGILICKILRRARFGGIRCTHFGEAQGGREGEGGEEWMVKKTQTKIIKIYETREEPTKPIETQRLSIRICIGSSFNMLPQRAQPTTTQLYEKPTPCLPIVLKNVKGERNPLKRDGF